MDFRILIKSVSADIEIVLLTIISLGVISCADRNRENPFDPSGTLNIFLNVSSDDRSVTLSWNLPAIEDVQGYNLYRSQGEQDSAFTLIAGALPAHINTYIDTHIEYQNRYNYYITVIGRDIESNPSIQVSIVPGPGFVWIVDKWGYQVLKTTYDVEHTIFRYFTNFPPEDMDVDSENKIGGIVYPSVGITEFIDLTDGSLLFVSSEINYPFRIACDPVEKTFWVIDSSGFLFQIDPIEHYVTLKSSFLVTPQCITIDQSNINVVDIGKKQILRFRRSGALNEVIEQIEGRILNSPQKFLVDDATQKYWYSEEIEIQDVLFVKNAGQEFNRIDSLENIGDFELTGLNDGVWYINQQGRNSTIVQLSGDGERQIELLGFWSPFDVHVNRYDQTLLVANTGLGRIEHYNSQHQLIGISTLLNVPVKVLVQ
jgi:hypothetical protein